MNKHTSKFGFSKTILLVLVAVLFLSAIGGFFYIQRKEPTDVQEETETETVDKEDEEVEYEDEDKDEEIEEEDPTDVESFDFDIEPVEEKRLVQPGDVSKIKIDTTPRIPSYDLPLEIEGISNFDTLMKEFNLNQRQLSMLKQNGFVVVDTPKEIAEAEVVFETDPFRSSEAPKEDFAAYYQEIGNRDLPLFVTTDSLLHYYHLFFGITLMRIERDIFYDDLWQMSEEFLEDSVEKYENSTGDLKEAAKRNAAYYSVALKLMKPKDDQILTEENIEEEFTGYIPEQIREEEEFLNFFGEKEAQKYDFEIPDFVEETVEKELELIRGTEGWDGSPIFIYEEDYSQYVPRGHYTSSERLKNYFKAMMWYGRMTALGKGSPNLQPGESFCEEEGIISEYDAKIQTLQAVLTTDKFLESETIKENWQRMYAITSFFVGFSDDLGPYEYGIILEDLFDGDFKLDEVKKSYPQVKRAVLDFPHDPKIYGGLGDCHLAMPTPPLTDVQIENLKEQAENLLSGTKGFRLMGQRFTIDSWIFSEIVSPYSGEYTGDGDPIPFTHVVSDMGREVRGFPRGLDLMAVLGSERAEDILKDLGDTDYCGYEEKLTELKEEINSLSEEDWTESLYMNWLYTLKPLLDEYQEGYQSFMQTEAWQDKNLNTALGSWAQLRHDTILYVKQSYTMAELGAMPTPPPPPGYVEPTPEFYSRLLNLTKMTDYGLKKLLSEEELSELRMNYTLERYSDVLDRIIEITEKELENEALTEEEYRFIKDFGTTSESLIGSISGGDVDPDLFKSSLIADVHTDGNTEKVLEEGTGHIDTLIVAYKLPDGEIALGVGPVFSYYEFKQPMKNRLTNEEWREMLEADPPQRPEWIETFRNK